MGVCGVGEGDGGSQWWLRRGENVSMGEAGGGVGVERMPGSGAGDGHEVVMGKLVGLEVCIRLSSR